MTDAMVVLDALGVPTRRAVLELLQGGEHTVRELTDAVEVSQPAVSQHLKVLADAGLVRSRPSGARRLYRIDPDGFAELRVWVDRFWDEALSEFAAFVDRDHDDQGETR
ncbi:ArsR/SmtB family transcription factor [Nocardioides sp.]|uniref:ArsR/SmtB family transcription factor n=1 Tax=Nocardioides sp. TaxID=35761 RepID=UPI0035278AF4